MIADELAAWAIGASTCPVAVRAAAVAAPARRRGHGARRRCGSGTVDARGRRWPRGLGGPPEATLFGTRRADRRARRGPGQRHARARPRLRRHPRRRAGARHRRRAAGRLRGRRAGRRDRSRGARRRRGRLRDGVPDRRRRAARRSTPAACTPRWWPGCSPRRWWPRGCMGLDAARAVERAGHRRQPGRRAARVPRTPARRPSSCTRASRRTPGSSPRGSPRPAPPARPPCFEGQHGLYDALADRRRSTARSIVDGLGRALGDHPDRHQALPGLPAHRTPRSTRSATRCAGAGSAPRTSRTIEVDVHPDSRADRLRRTARPGPARLAVRRQVLAAVERGRAGPRRRRDDRHLRARIARPAGGGGARPAGRGGR